MSNLAILPFRLNNDNNIQQINFAGRASSSSKLLKQLPKIEHETPKKSDPRDLSGVAFYLASKVINAANKQGVNITTYLEPYLKHLMYVPAVPAEPSKTAIVGKTNVTTLIDGEQIFGKTLEYLQSAEKSIQVEMFEFQNLRIDGHKWPTNGAEVVPGSEGQQRILDILLSKKKENPNLKIQIILDAHKWYINGNGEKDKHYSNQDMIKYLKEKKIDVVPYPRAAQQGAALQHVKMLAVDGKKVIIGGMNWGNHSAANHDACVSIETIDGHKNSEVDNIIEEIFNKDWKFAWQRLGSTKVIAGPLDEAEQEFYTRMQKEIKQENVDYMETVGKLFETPENKNRYEEGRLDLIPTNPVLDPKIKVLVTKPKELVFVGEKGLETTREHLQSRLKTAQKVRAELFVLSDKELIETIVDRHKKGELDAQFIVESSILEEFPYCRNAYDELMKNGVPVRLYKADEKISQRMHAKWAVFDDKELVIGSTNWSAMGLNSNLKKGQREDYELHVEKINAEISEKLLEVKEHEDLLGIPALSRHKFDYKELLERRTKLKTTMNALNKYGVASTEFDHKKYDFMDDSLSEFHTVQGYYGIIKKRHNAKEKYKRGNNECAIAFEKPSLAKVFLKQFDRDWKHSASGFDKLQNKVKPKNKQPLEEKALDIMG